MCVAKLDGYKNAKWENPLNYSRPWARSTVITLRMSDKLADLLSVNNGTPRTFYIQQYSSFTKPLGTAIVTVPSFMSTNIKLSIHWRSYLSLPATFLGTDWHSSSATEIWSCLSLAWSMIPMIPTITMISRSQVNLAAHLDTARQPVLAPVARLPQLQYSQLSKLRHSLSLFAFCCTDCSSEITWSYFLFHFQTAATELLNCKLWNTVKLYCV